MSMNSGKEKSRWLLVAALASAFTATPVPGLRSEARAQARVTAEGVYGAEARNPLRINSLGENPVANSLGAPISVRETRETREALSAVTPAWANSYLENTLRLLNGYTSAAREGAASDQILVTRVRTLLASQARLGGSTQALDITGLLREHGYTVDAGISVTIQASSGGLSRTFAAGTQSSGGPRGDGVTTINLGAHDGITIASDGNGAVEGIDIRVRRTQAVAGGATRVDNAAWFAADGCGNVYAGMPTATSEIAAVTPLLVERPTAPCINVRVRPPRGVRFTNENVHARVLVLDMNSGTTYPAEECPVDTGQVQVNCDNDCVRVLREAADRSPGFAEVVQRVRRERGTDAAISRVFTADARITDAAGGEDAYITVPVRADKLNRNFVTIVCFDWENGGSSTVVIHNPGEADSRGFIRDRLVMEGAGQNMDVFEGRRRVSRGADRTE